MANLKLTRGEKFLINRRRGLLSQQEAADALGLSRADYGRVERDQLGCNPVPKLGRLEAHERCFLYRRRAGQTQQQVAEALGCCRWVVNQMEKGDKSCDELLWYWEQ